MVTAFWWFLGFLYVIMGLFWFAMWLGYARDSRYAADTKRASRFALCAPGLAVRGNRNAHARGVPDDTLPSPNRVQELTSNRELTSRTGSC